ncbi:MAG: gamma carbonic anhydrase family protein [Agathobacter sp.]
MLETKGAIADSAVIVEQAVVVGDVTIGADSTVLYHAVLRGDDNRIIVGNGSNIQDNCTVHADEDAPVTIGNYVTIGHNAVIHGCTIGDNSLIGMGAIVMNHTVIGKNCLIAAGSLVLENQTIPDGSLVMGSPARIARSLTEEEMKGLTQSAEHYIRIGNSLRI